MRLFAKVFLKESYHNYKSSRGFTLIELLIVMGIFSIMVALAMVNPLYLQPKSNLDASVSVLMSDLRSQQLKSMAGESGGSATAQPYGIFFGSSYYTLFKGSTYSAADSSNFVVTLDSTMSLSQTFPSSQLIFNRRSGELSPGGTYTITLTNTITNQAKTITINTYGGITLN